MPIPSVKSPDALGRKPVRARSALPRPDRRQNILLAAERLFASEGYHAVSIRQIADAAGVPLALVGYYFGQKHELFEAIFEHWRPTLDERLAGLRAAPRRPGDPAALRQIIESFVEPVLRLRASPEGEYYALLVARELYRNSAETDRILRGTFDPLALAYIDALGDVLPHANRAQAAWVYQFALGALLHHISDNRVERLSLGAAVAADPTAAGLLIDFIVGGIQAALPPPHKTKASGPVRPAPARARATPSRSPTPTTRRRNS